MFIQVVLSTTINNKYTLSVKAQLRTTIENFNQIFIDGFVINHKFNIFYPYEVCMNNFSWKEVSSALRYNQEIDMRR